MKLAARLSKLLAALRASDTGSRTRNEGAALPAPLIVALEPRIVYDGSVAAIGVAAAQHHQASAEAGAATAARDVAVPPAAGSSLSNFALQAGMTAARLAGTPTQVRAVHGYTPFVAAETNGAGSAGAQGTVVAPRQVDVVAGSAAGTGDTSVLRAVHGYSDVMGATTDKQVVFVNSNVSDYQTLVAGLPQGTQVVILDSTKDGLSQIEQYLQQHPGVDAIHLVAHGADGNVQIGSTWLNQGDLSAYSAELAQIGAAMKPGGDFLIYGCDVAQNADGKALVQEIASITGLNVAASTDATGAAALGGDWTLEYDAGHVATPVIFSQTAEAQYGDLLSQTVETYDAPALVNSGNGSVVATHVTSFNLDGITYTTDGAVTTGVYTANQSSPLSTSAADGVLMINQPGDVNMTKVTITLQNGDAMGGVSFDFDEGLSDGSIVVEPNGNAANEITLAGSQLSGHVDLSGYSQFKGVTSIVIVDVGDSGTFTPTLNNFTYTDLSSPPHLTASGGSSAFVAADNATSTPVVVDSGITLSDGDSTTATSATVSITGNFQGSGEDVLAFTNTNSTTYGDISASYTPGTGVLTLTSSSGTASITQWQAALRAVTYTDTHVTPNTATRTISFEITSDGFTAGNTVTKTVTVADTDQTPIVHTTGGTTATYDAGASSATIDGSVSVADADNTTQASATVSISGGFQSGDTLGLTVNGSTMGNIAVQSYNSATGVLTLTSVGSTATLADWDNALSAVKFSSTSTTLGSRTISFTTSDGTKTSTAATDTVSVVTPVQVTTDSGSAVFVAGDNATSTPVVIDSGLTVSDASGNNLSQVTVSITGGFQSGKDVLSFTNDGSTMGNIVEQSYNSVTGVLTLTSSSNSATLANWQSALQSVTYTNTAITPSNATRTISFNATDTASFASNTATRTVTVTDTDQTPIVTTTGGTTNYVGATSAVTIDGSVSVTDRDNTTQASGTVSVSGGFHSGDTLIFTNDGSTMGNIAGAYNAATGVLTLTSSGSTATLAQWDSALSSVTFASTSTTYGNRTISFTTSDGTKTSTARTDTINITAPPTLTTDSGSAAFVAGDNTTSTPVAIDSGLTVTDGSAATLSQVTVVITGGFQSGKDVLSFTNDGSTMGNIVEQSYNSVTGVLTLTSSSSSATLAQWQSALQSVTFTNTAVTPSNATRTISFTAVDGASNTSNTATRTVSVTDTDQTPIVTTTHGTTNYVGGTSAATIDGGVTVTDLDNTTQSTGVVSITSGFHSGDTLTFVNSNSTTFGNIIGSYNAGTGVLTLVSSGDTASDTQWSNALSAVTFSSGSSATPGNRTISFVTNDGIKTSAASTDTVTVLGPPTITTDSGSASFVAGDNVTSTPVAIDSGLTLTDGTAPTLASATVSITGNFHSGEDRLAFTNTSAATFGNISASYNASTGVLTLTSSSSSATLAQWQAALDAVTYSNTAITPDNSTRTISFAAVDTSAITSNTATRTVTVADTDQTPIVTTTGGTTNYIGGTSATAIDSGISVSDRDNTTQSFGTVSITSGFHSGDTLSFVNTSSAAFGNIVASYNAGTGVLTLTSSGDTSSNLQWTNAFRAVTFSAGASATPGNRTVSFVINDGTVNSASSTQTVDLLGPPTITTDAGSAAFVAGDNAPSTPVAIDSGLTLTDSGAPTLASATVSITGNFHSGEDVLSFTNTSSATFGNISASYNASTGVLMLTSSGASASLGQWQAALDSVTYTDTAVTPNNATRTISFTATDTGGTTSNTATRTVTVADTDQTPIVTTTGGATNYASGLAPTIVNPHVSVTDLDNTTQSSGTVSITGNFQTGDTLGFTNTSSFTFGNIVASYNAGTGVLTLTSSGATATDAQWSNALSAVTFSSSSASFGNRTISFATNDGTTSSAAASATVAFADRPHVTTDSGSAAFTAADNATSAPVIVSPGLTLTDASVSAGSTSLSSATVTITGGFHAGQDVLSFTNDGATMGNITASYNASTGVLTLTSAGGTATLDAWRSALASVTYTDTAVVPDNTTRTIGFTVTDSNGAASDAQTRNVTVTDTDQTPTLSVSGGVTFISQVRGSTPVAVAPQVTLGDRDPSATLTSAQVTISGGLDAGHDTLALTGAGASGFTSTYNASSGVLTVTWTGTGKPTLGAWQSALESVTYSNSAFRASGSRTVTLTVTDGVKTSVAASNTIAIVTGRSGGTPTSALPTTTTTDTSDTSTSTSSTSHSAGSDNAGAPDVLDELGNTQPIGSVPIVPTMTFSDPSAPAGSYSIDRATVSRFDATALDATLAVTQTSDMPTSASEMDVPVPEHDPFSIEVATLLPPSVALQGAASDMTVQLADGRSLPGWLHYDAAAGVLRGKVPPGVQDVRIVVEARDASGHVSRREVVLAPHARNSNGNGHDVAHPNHVQRHPHSNPNGHAALDLTQPLAARAARPVGKPSLDQQFAQARAALHVTRAAGAVRRV